MHNQEGPQEQEFESCSTCVETDVNRQKKSHKLAFHRVGKIQPGTGY